jgi:MerR family mercuric resistance operon transcriptional regulator
MEWLTIGKLAKQAGVHIETIRYYEKRGLIPRPRRSSSGYRQFSADSVSLIHFIKHAQDLGFSLKEIGELLSLRLDENTPCSEVKGRAESKIEDIDEKIGTLQRMRKALIKLTKACSGRGPVSECPILEALEK